MTSSQLMRNQLTKLDLELLGETSIRDNSAVFHTVADCIEQKADKDTLAMISESPTGSNGQAIKVGNIGVFQCVN